MKWIFGAAGAVAALVLSAGTAFAAPGQSQTQTVHGLISDSLPLTCAGIGTGTTSYTGTGNSIQHFNFNNTGGWFTTTTEGIVTLVMTPGQGAATTYTGHITEWFGQADNNQNGVQHATVDFNGTNVAGGAALRLHAAFDTTTNADGTTTANHFNVSCS